MSSAGTTHRELVYGIEESIAGSKTIHFIVENDGCIVSIERLTGTATITGSLSSNLPNGMATIPHEDFLINSSTVYTMAYVTHSQVQIDLAWSGACSFKVAVKMSSGIGISEWRNQNELMPLQVGIISSSPYTDSLIRKIYEEAKVTNDLLSKLVNHQRFITDIEEDDDSEF